jgi:transcription elongation GreA/GreB family factor
MTRPDKTELLEALRARLAQEFRTLQDSQQAAQEGATHDEARQEDSKDTRAIEAQYIARGLAERVEDLRATRAALANVQLNDYGPDDPIGLFALVGLTDGKQENLYFLVPVAGGETFKMNGSTVQTLTPGSPLGQALLDKQVDDDIELELPQRILRATVDWIC